MEDDGTIASWFLVSPSGEVFVSQTPDRSRAAVVTLPVSVTDQSAPVPQITEGEDMPSYKQTNTLDMFS